MLRKIRLAIRIIGRQALPSIIANLGSRRRHSRRNFYANRNAAFALYELDPILAEHGWQLDPAWLVPDAADNEAYVDRVLATLGGRFSNLLRLAEQIGFFFTEEFPIDQQVWQEHVAPAETRQHLALLAERLGSDLDITAPQRTDAYEAVIRSCAEELQVKAGVLIHPCRLALTGQTRSAGIFEVMELVGGPRVLARLHRAAGA